MLSPGLLLILAAGAVAPAPQVQIQASSQEIRPVRIAAVAFGHPVEVEVRNLPRDQARAAIEAALAEVAELERLTRAATPDAGGLGAVNAAAGTGPRPVSPKLMPLLVRAQEFCVWSEGAHGPLGGDLYSLWGLRGAPAAAEPPDPESLQQAAGVAQCDRLRLVVANNTAELGAGSRLDLRGFVEGYAVDQAVETLRKNGVTNGFVQLGTLQRGIGGGADGRGWKIVLPRFPGTDNPAGRFLLKDRSAAILSILEDPLRVADQALLPYINQRTGLPTPGTVGVATVTEMAVDAQALAIAMALTGPREGQLRMGSLRPSPSVLWFLGNGTGVPLQADHRWSDVISASR